MLILNISGAAAISYYFVCNETLNLSNKKRKLSQLNQYPPRKNQTLYGTTVSILLNMGDFSQYTVNLTVWSTVQVRNSSGTHVQPNSIFIGSIERSRRGLPKSISLKF